MKRPLGWACLLFILFIRLFYVCFPPSLPDYTSIQGKEVYINGQITSIKVQELYGELQTMYTLSDVTLQESSGASYDSYLSDKSSSAYNTQEKISNSKENNGNAQGTELYSHAKIYCYAEQAFSGVHIGSWVWVKGTFEPYEASDNPGQFDSRFYYHVQNIGASLKETQLIWSDYGRDDFQEALQTLKSFFLEKLNVSFSAKYGGVMKTILLGDKTDLDKELKKLFQEGGILHILTISGLHISMLGMGSFRLLRKIGASPKAAAIVGLLIVIFYGAMIGTQAATFRAICMFVMQMAAILLGRTYDRLTGLSVAAVLLLLEQPLYVFYSGFLLSFGAVLGVTVVPPILGRFAKEKGAVVRWLIKQFSGGVGILLATFPIQLFSYYEYPIYSMLINVLVLPFLPYIVGLGMIVLAVPGAASILTVPVVWGCEGLLYAYEWVCLRSQELPYHSVVLGAPTWWQMVCYYGCLMVWVYCINNCEAVRSGSHNIHAFTKSMSGVKHTSYGLKAGWLRRLDILSVLTFCMFLISALLLLWRPVEGLTCHFLSVGQGDCALIQNGEETYIIDCGSTSNSNAGNQILLPCLKYYGVKEVAGVFISHADADHMNGIVQWLDEYAHSHVRIGSIILPGLAEEALQEEFAELIVLAEQHAIPIVTLAAGDRLQMGELTIDVLHPEQNYGDTEDANGYSQVLLFTYAGQSVLMTGDIGEAQESALCDEVKGAITILKAAHHGSKYSSSAEFLEVCNPQHVILSYGIDNSYGHPHREAVERLQDTGGVLWYTGRQGAIECVLTENGVRIKGFR